MENTSAGYIIIAVLVTYLWGVGEGATSAPMIVFGDSLVDQGNNNYLLTIARCDFRPYGIDFPDGATGRFSNGRIISDFLSEMMGTKPISAWLSPASTGNELLRGINFASAGAGILEDTGSVFISRLTIPRQLEMFVEYQNALQRLIGQSATAELIGNAIYNVNVGGNDWVNNYVLSNTNKSREYTPSQFIDLLISTYKQQLQKLYSLGARKIVVSNIGPIGCAPSMLNRFGATEGQCIDSLQQNAINFNNALKPLLEELTKKLPGSVFVYSNGFDILMDVIKNPTAHGFETVNQGCCGQGKFKGFFTCTRLSFYCGDRSKYVFWDAFHPTEAANMLIARRVFSGSTSDISPMNVQRLLNLNLTSSPSHL